MQCQSASRLPDGGVRGEEAGDLVGSHGPDTILAAVDKLTNEEVLDVLAGHQPVTLAELGRLLICEQGSPSRLVDSLVQRDLVSRAPHGQDRRAVLLELTAEGRDLAGRLGEATGRLTAAETETLVGLLRTLLASRVLSPVERTLGRMADEHPRRPGPAPARPRRRERRAGHTHPGQDRGVPRALPDPEQHHQLRPQPGRRERRKRPT
jgi:DNA-binding MarR family transcriptional regulator